MDLVAGIELRKVVIREESRHRAGFFLCGAGEFV
jgi:hypothetical protein